MSAAASPHRLPAVTQEFLYVTVDESDYVPHSNPAYAGNPFIECLDQYQDAEWLCKRLERRPKWDPSQRHLSAALRGQLATGLSKLVIALPRLTELARSIIDLKMEGYVGREPFKPRHNLVIQTLYKRRQALAKARQEQVGAQGLAAVSSHIEEDLDDEFDQLEYRRTPVELSTAFIGVSGIGKTMACYLIQSLQPLAIYHSMHGVWQIPVLIIRFPSDGRSLHTLATAIILAIHKLLPHAGYKEEYLRSKGGKNASERVYIAQNLLHSHAVGVLLVDESQDQKNATKRKASVTIRKRPAGPEDEERTIAPEDEAPIISLLISASNEFRIPLVLVGTNELLDIMEGRFTRSRRSVGYGLQQWGLLSASGDLQNPADYELLLLSLWEYQWLHEDVPLTPSMAKLFHRLTQANPDITVKLYISVIKSALKIGRETFDEKFVEDVFDLEYRAVRKALDALAKNDPEKLVRYPDIAPTDLRTGPGYAAAAARMHAENIARRRQNSGGAA